MNKLLPYETIVKAHEGDPDAIDTILYGNAGHHFSVFVINGYAYTAFFSCVLLLFACYRQEDRTY